MSNDPRAQLADAITLEAERVPALPDDVPATGAEGVYVRCRVAELAAIWRCHGIDPVSALVVCSPELASLLGHIGSVDGIVVSVLPDSSSQDDDAGSFTVDFDADHPAAVWVRPALGIAFPGPVDAGRLATRWVLQEHDGMSAGDAERSSLRL